MDDDAGLKEAMSHPAPEREVKEYRLVRNARGVVQLCQRYHDRWLLATFEGEGAIDIRGDLALAFNHAFEAEIINLEES